MGIRLRDGGFRSHSAAQLAGKQALDDLLNGLAIEAGREIPRVSFNTARYDQRCDVAGFVSGQERELLVPEGCLNLILRIAQNGMAVTFIVQASRGEEVATTIRLSAEAAIAKARALAAGGWHVLYYRAR